MPTIQFDIDPKKLQSKLLERITRYSNQFTMEMIENIVVEQVEEYLEKLVSSGKIIRYEFVHHSHGRETLSLRELSEK